MSCFRVLSTAAALVIAGCVATAQASVTNIFANLDKVIPDASGATGTAVTLSASGNNIHSYQNYLPVFNGDQPTGTWAPDGRYVDPNFVEGTDPQTSLLNSFNRTNPNGAWPLFLADLDFGEQGTLVNWGAVITAVPEPSAWTLLSLGGFTLGMRFRRRHTA
jgi:hypothetical protein